jgi:hypothetical protein
MIYHARGLTIRLLPFYGSIPGALLRHKWTIAGFHTWRP